MALALHLARSFGAAGLAAGIGLWPAALGAAPRPNCFSAADNARLSFEVYQQAPPPRPRARAYPFYPMTAVTTMQLGSLGAAPAGIQTYYYHWANRASVPLVGATGQQITRKLNLEPSLAGRRRQRSSFSSIARADACTLAQAASLLGQPARAQELARAGGVTLVSEAAIPDTTPASPQDSCVLAAGTLPRQATGIVLDYEVQDGRDGAATERFLQAYASLVHAAGKKAILLVNPLDSPGEQRFTGITAANAHRIVALFDRTTLILWSGNAEHSLPASYAAQMAIVRAGGPVEGKRLLINFELAGTTLDDARFVRRVIRQDHLAGVMFWRNRAVQGGPCDTPVNGRIAAVALGDAAATARQGPGMARPVLSFKPARGQM
jgi:hypothetical protein